MYDIDKLSERIASLGYKKGSKIHEAFLSLAFVLGVYELGEEDEDVVLDLLSREGRGHVHKLPWVGEDSWEDFNYGNVGIGDYVRVKTDAYDSDSGKRHNGMVGIMTSMSNGVASVRYLGVSPERIRRHNKRYLDSLKRNVK